MKFKSKAETLSGECFEMDGLRWKNNEIYCIFLAIGICLWKVWIISFMVSIHGNK